MRLATFNLLNGRSPADGLVRDERLHDAVAGLDADVLAVQEVDRGQDRSGGADQTALAARALGAGHARFAPAIVGTPGVDWRPATEDDRTGDEPGYGVGLVSRRPVARWVHIPLGDAPGRLPLLVDGRPMLVGDEPRVALAAVLEAPTKIGTVVATHLSFTPGWNVAQLRRLARAVRTLPGPVVLLGDLNLPGPVPGLVLGRAWRALVRTPTFPVGEPKVQLDHVLARADDHPVSVLGTRTVATPISDHRALVVELDD